MSKELNHKSQGQKANRKADHIKPSSSSYTESEVAIGRL